MDDQRFDNLSRIIARSTTRRSTVKGIAAAIGGGVFASVFGVRAQRASAAGGDVAPGGACTGDTDCAEGTCSEAGVCFCNDPNEPVIGCSCNTGDADPCGGTPICCPSSDLPGSVGICVPASEGCDPTGNCRDVGEQCGEGADCCAGFLCDSGTCINNCQEPGGLCEFDENCCIGTCMSGTCACEDPAQPWMGCACDTGTDAPCGGGTTLCCPTGTEPGGPGVCTSGMAGCQVICTSEPGGECASDDDCCTGTCSDEGICFCSDPDRPWIGCPCTTGTENPCDGALCRPTGSTPGGPGVCTSNMAGCETPGECTAIGASCATSDECCDELVCLDSGVCGIATTVVLPSTGSGMSNGSNLGAWIGATAAVGAAAALAGRKLNPKSSEGSNEA